GVPGGEGLVPPGTHPPDGGGLGPPAQGPPRRGVGQPPRPLGAPPAAPRPGRRAGRRPPRQLRLTPSAGPASNAPANPTCPRAGAVKDFARHFRRLCRDRGVTPYRLAQVTGLSQQGILNLERAGADPKLSTLVKLAEALGVRPWELLPGWEGRETG